MQQPETEKHRSSDCRPDLLKFGVSWSVQVGIAIAVFTAISLLLMNFIR